MKKLFYIFVLFIICSCSQQKYVSENIHLKLMLKYDSLYIEKKITIDEMNSLKKGEGELYYLYKQDKIFKK